MTRIDTTAGAAPRSGTQGRPAAGPGGIRRDPQASRRDRVLALLGHEMRNPLAALTTGVQVLRELERRPEGREGQRRDVLDMMEHQLGLLQRFVDDLQDASYLRRAGGTLRRERVRVADVVQQALESTRTLFLDNRQTVEISLPADLAVEGDLQRLVQAVSNLLSNAARYTPPGGTVTIAARAEGDELTLAVRDNGRGIAADHLEIIFEPFLQLEEGQGIEHGLGLGLALVRQIASLHGGRVEAASAGPGRGATFTLALPLCRPAEPQHPAAARAGPDSDPGAPTSG
ncbi:MAG TPA: HAMP domain-containing sensor histidine kinase [Thermoanaerobaculia bacterium]|nr:HAMP domain-containing sensor histidine kinase [Thermoanaerobaculia bacterium]